MDTSLRPLGLSQAWSVLVLCLGGMGIAPAEPPAAESVAGVAASDEAPPVPQENVLASITQAFKQDYDRQVVRGHFDVGSPPDAHRYYCLVDPKTGKRQPNGVPGRAVPRSDGMTGVKASSVSVYSCASAEQQGILITAGYILVGKAAAASLPLAQQPPVASDVAAEGVPPAKSPADRALTPAQVDVAGVTLGMSVEEVRAILKSKQLLDYFEAKEALGLFDARGSATSAAGGRFMNVIAAWTATRSSRGDGLGEDGESYEVMFTPVPARERVMAVVHSVSHTPAHGIREATLGQGLVEKYGGSIAARELSASPTWEIHGDGSVQGDDSCKRRAIVGGLADVNIDSPDRQNLALRTTPDEFRFQIEHCGVAIVTEDHVVADNGATHGDRLVTRYTVTAYSPSLAFEGATAAARLIQSGAAAPAAAAHTKNQAVPTL